MSGKPQYTVEQVARALVESKGLLSPAAEALGCSYHTVRNYIERHPTLKQVKENEREKFIDKAEHHLYDQIGEGNIAAIIFTLKTIGKERGYVERSEHAGVPGQPLEVVVKWASDSGADANTS